MVRLNVQDSAIYSSKAHCVVALSRHRKNFDYYTVKEDNLHDIIKNKNWSKSIEIDDPIFFNVIEKTKDDIYEIEEIRSYVRENPNEFFLTHSDNLFNWHDYNEMTIRKQFQNDRNNKDINKFKAVDTSNIIIDFINELFNYSSVEDMMETESKMVKEFPENTVIDRGNFDLLDDERTMKKTNCQFRSNIFLDNFDVLIKPRVVNNLMSRNIMPMNLRDVRDFADADQVCEMFFDTFIDLRKMESALKSRSFGNRKMSYAWWASRDLNQRKLMRSNFKLELNNMKSYSAFVKPRTKTQLTGLNTKTAVAGQVVTAQNNFYVSACTAATKYLDSMLKECLKEEWSITDGLSFSEFEGFINFLGNKGDHIPISIDISKFDKSQDSFSLECQLKIMKRFGMDEDFLEFWRNNHSYSRLHYRNVDLVLETGTQRRSGETFTLLLNSIVNMSVLCCCYDLKNKSHGGAFCGDDSLIFFKSNEKLIDVSEILSRGFNFFAKYEPTDKYIYYVSKFIIRYDNRYVTLPNVLKNIVKLARDDIKSVHYLKDLQESLLEIMRYVSDIEFINILGELTEIAFPKLNWTYRFSDIIIYFHQLLQDFSNFKKLYLIHDLKEFNRVKTYSKDLEWSRKFYEMKEINEGINILNA